MCYYGYEIIGTTLVRLIDFKIMEQGKVLIIEDDKRNGPTPSSDQIPLNQNGYNFGGIYLVIQWELNELSE